ncbi:MAG: hypothetical protein A2132_05675 [Nitrospirae bacterium RBG_16_43_11]|nr:MAG: hypothetical protein A2132_05675 [Nitrospirae bacterium RBG_16_43_11]
MSIDVIQEKQFTIKAGVLIFFVLFGLVIYFNSLKNDFHYDDRHHITTNAYIRSPGNIPLFFTEPRTFSSLSTRFRHYRPMVLASYAVNHYFGGLNPLGYHLVNLGLHVGSAFILFLIMHAMLEGKLFIPLAAGILFLTTPFNSEVVNYITARSSVMCSFFYLLSFYCWVRFRGQKKSYFYIASILAFLLAMLTKEIAITLPAILFLYDYYFERSLLRKIYQYLPFVLIGTLTGFMARFIFFGSFNEGAGKKLEDSFHFVTKVKVLATYLYHTIVPAQLSIQHFIQESLDVYFFLSLIIILLLAVLAVHLLRNPDRTGKVISFFIAWFFIVLLPVVAFSLNTPYQENRGYLSGVGVMAILAAGMAIFKTRWDHKAGLQKAVIYGLPVILVTLYSAGTIVRNPVWLNDLTLWSDVMIKYPESIQAHYNIGNYYNKLGDKNRAEAEYKAILKIEPGNYGALTRLGEISYMKGDLDTGMKFLQQAWKTAPLEATANQIIALVYREKGDLLLSSRHLLFVLTSSPHNLRIYELLMENYAGMGKLDDAYKMINKALKEDPGNPGARRGLGLIYMFNRQWEAAQREFEKVLLYMPNDYRTLTDLVYIYSKLGMSDAAEKQGKKVLSLYPQDSAVAQILGDVYQKQGRVDEAMKLYEMALKTDRGQFNSYNNLGLVYFDKGDMPRARVTFEEGIKQYPSNHIIRFNLARVYERQGKNELARLEYQKVLKATSKGEDTKEIYQAAREKLTALN